MTGATASLLAKRIFPVALAATLGCVTTSKRSADQGGSGNDAGGEAPSCGVPSSFAW